MATWPWPLYGYLYHDQGLPIVILRPWPWSGHGHEWPWTVLPWPLPWPRMAMDRFTMASRMSMVIEQVAMVNSWPWLWPPWLAER